MKIGAFISSFALGVEDSLEKCRRIGLNRIQLADVKDELHIEQLTETGTAACKSLVESYGLQVSSVCGDLGGHEFTNEIDVEERIARTKHIMDITRALGCGIVQTHIGKISDDLETPECRVMRYALDILGEYGDKIGVCLATETGPEKPAVMKAFLDTIKHSSIKVNYDPANLVMNGFDQIGGVSILADYIVHTHAKDGTNNGVEVPLGEGSVDFQAYLKALKDIGYDGFFVIERETGSNPVGDIEAAAHYLKSL